MAIAARKFGAKCPIYFWNGIGYLHDNDYVMAHEVKIFITPIHKCVRIKLNLSVFVNHNG